MEDFVALRSSCFHSSSGYNKLCFLSPLDRKQMKLVAIPLPPYCFSWLMLKPGVFEISECRLCNLFSCPSFLIPYGTSLHILPNFCAVWKQISTFLQSLRLERAHFGGKCGGLNMVTNSLLLLPWSIESISFLWS